MFFFSGDKYRPFGISISFLCVCEEVVYFMFQSLEHFVTQSLEFYPQYV